MDIAGIAGIPFGDSTDFNSLPWKIPKITGGLVRGNHLFLAMASMAMLNNQSICLSMNLPRRMMIYFILSVLPLES